MAEGPGEQMDKLCWPSSTLWQCGRPCVKNCSSVCSAVGVPWGPGFSGWTSLSWNGISHLNFVAMAFVWLAWSSGVRSWQAHVSGSLCLGGHKVWNMETEGRVKQESPSEACPNRAASKSTPVTMFLCSSIHSFTHLIQQTFIEYLIYARSRLCSVE